MKARTDTQCTYCIHGNVCAKLNRPVKIVEAISGFNAEDDNGIDIVVSCIDFESIKSTLRNGNFLSKGEK